jgi:hypothetical protein
MFTFSKAPKPTPIEEWVGHQPNDVPRNGRLLEDEEKPKHLPSKLVMVMDDKKRKRITVPLAQQLPLTRQAHETPLHQKGQRVFHDLEREYSWTNMEKDVPDIYKTYVVCSLH